MKTSYIAVLSLILGFGLAYLWFSPNRYAPMPLDSFVLDTWTGRVYRVDGVPIRKN